MKHTKAIIGYRTFFVAFLSPPLIYVLVNMSSVKFENESVSNLIVFLIIWLLLLSRLIKVVTISENAIVIKRLLFFWTKDVVVPFNDIVKIQLSALPRSTFASMKIYKRDSSVVEFRLGLMNYELRKLAQKLNKETAFITEEKLLL